MVKMTNELYSANRENRIADSIATNDRRLRRSHAKALPDWLFLSRRGELINADWPRRVFAKVLKRAGLPWHTPYDLRHTFATLHLAKGHPITYVSAQLGHSDPSTTLRWYAHWLPTSDKRFADALDSPGSLRRTKS